MKDSRIMSYYVQLFEITPPFTTMIKSNCFENYLIAQCTSMQLSSTVADL